MAQCAVVNIAQFCTVNIKKRITKTRNVRSLASTDPASMLINSWLASSSSTYVVSEVEGAERKSMDTRQKDTKTQEEEDDAVAWADHRRRQSRPSAAAVMQLLLEGFMNCQRSRDELMEKEPAARGWVEHVRV